MDSTFDLGDMGELVVMSGLSSIYHNVKEVPKDINTQMEWCDIVIPPIKSLGHEVQRLEVKTERRYTGNLFFETLSNQTTGREGWAITSKADTLYYLFWDSAIGYKIPMFQEVKFLFQYYKNTFMEMEQQKHQQTNITIGRLVPIQWVLGLHVQVKQFDFSATKKLIESGELKK